MFPYYDPSLLDKNRDDARERSCGSSALGGHVQPMYSTSRARNLDDVHGFSWKMESSCSEERQLLVDTCSEERQLLVDTMGSNIINIEDVNLVRLFLFITGLKWFTKSFPNFYVQNSSVGKSLWRYPLRNFLPPLSGYLN